MTNLLLRQEILFVVLRSGCNPGVLLRSVQRLISKVFVPAVTMNPSDLDNSPGGVSARDHLLAGLRSFASCLQGNLPLVFLLPCKVI